MLVQDFSEEVKSLKACKKSLKSRIAALEAFYDEEKHTMMTWQTAGLVFRALGVFAWSELSAKTRAQLATHGIVNFCSLERHMQSSSTNNAAAIAAKAAYHSMSKDILRYVLMIAHFKSGVSEDRNKFAHPVISQEFMELFLDDLGAREPHLSPLQVRLFDHLRTTSTTIQGPHGQNQPKTSVSCSDDSLSEKVKKKKH
ncbi:hypothetical protein PILCRDRAFT_12117 [Piloderma croceum F 1598]|uniref:Uncharacterized protein n=1 Tax=Piloderma croceum (strain F 1598) TaxID=765440 RepID=A0A0C3FC17_PILCF|nr:hypothetical protein PILCRDRAFT_12117 [Piloderma croceum F 1598]